MNLIIDNWNNEEINSFDNYLYSLRREEKIDWTRNIVNTKMDLLAIILPDLKKMAKEIYKGNYISYLELMDLIQQVVLRQAVLEVVIAGNAHRHQRQLALAGVEAVKIHRCLDGDRVDVAEHDVHELKVVEVQLLRLRKVVVQKQLADPVHLLRANVREYRDNAQRTERHEGHGLVVVAGIDVELVAAERADQRHL